MTKDLQLLHLNFFLEECKEHHRDQVNRGRFQLLFKPENIVMVHEVVQSNAATDVVSKKSYQTRRPFIVIESTNHGS